MGTVEETGLRATKLRTVEAQVAKLNADGRLDTELTQQQIDEIKNTIRYSAMDS